MSNVREDMKYCVCKFSLFCFNMIISTFIYIYFANDVLLCQPSFWQPFMILDLITVQVVTKVLKPDSTTFSAFVKKYCSIEHSIILFFPFIYYSFKQYILPTVSSPSTPSCLPTYLSSPPEPFLLHFPSVKRGNPKNINQICHDKVQ